MKILILGGTVFLGRHLVDAARAAGHEVTLFNRGRSDASLFGDLEQLRGDRDGGLDALRGRRWDAVIDTSGYVPRVVRQSTQLLADAVDRHVFISTGSVYPLTSDDKSEATGPVETLDDPATEDVHAHYGALKAACEKVVTDVVGEDRALHVRSGLIVGPHDPTERFTYWVLRMPAGGEALAPGGPDRHVQFIDARDQAAWIVTMLEAGRAGTYNVTGSSRRLGDVLAACGDATPVWAGDEFLLGEKLAPYMDLPLWIPDGMGNLLMPSDRARAAGLRTRPLPDTVAATREWADSRPARPEPQESGGRRRKPAGISREREAALLDLWRSADHQ
jgi:2'-hydroxyisoflavone reductase